MSVVVPIDNNAAKCMEYIFENAEMLPNDFYIDIMNLVKNFHENGNNYSEIHGFLELNKNKVDDSILKQIKIYIKLPPEPPKETWSFKIECTGCSIICTACGYCLCFIIMFGFIGVIAWAFVSKK